MGQIHDLPTEVLDRIFRWFIRILRNSRLKPLSVILFVSTEPLRLVCHRWNQIITSDPWFWSEISIEIDALGIRRSNRWPPSDLVSVWIERSASSMLDISLWLSGFRVIPEEEVPEWYPPARAQQYFFLIFPLLAKQVPRWRTLNVNGNIGFLISSMFLDCLNNAIHLQHVNIQIQDIDETFTDFSMFTSTLEKLLSFRSLDIHIMSGFFMQPRHLLRLYHQIRPNTLFHITDLYIRNNLDVPTILTIMRACASLITLQLYFLPLNTVPTSGRVQLQHLKTLALDDMPWNAHSLFNCLVLPSLDVLSIQPSTHLPHCYDAFISSIGNFLANTPRVPRIIRLHVFLSLRQILPLFSNQRLFDAAFLLVSLEDNQAGDLGGVKILREKLSVLLRSKEANRFDFSKHDHYVGWMEPKLHREWAFQEENPLSRNVIEQMLRFML